MWSGWNLFEELPKGRERKQSEVSMIFYTGFEATELQPDNISFRHFFASNKIKIKNYPLSLKLLRKALALLKYIYILVFSLQYYLPSQEFKIVKKLKMG